MPDKRFHTNLGPFTLGEIAANLKIELPSGIDPSFEITDVAPIDSATEKDITFLDNPKYADQLKASKAGACILHPKNASLAPEGMKLLPCDIPYLAYAKTASMFYPREVPEDFYADETTVIDLKASMGHNCHIHPNAVIGRNADIGHRTIIGAGAVIGDNVVIGNDCVISANTVISHAIIGNNVTILPNASIGQEGFGFATDQGKHISVPQLGRVIIEDDVHIGANTTIDRGAGPDTVIGAGTRIDNLVQIGHNVKIGRGCVIVSQVGISGSAKIEDYVVLAGQVGVIGHITIGRGAVVSAKSGIGKDVPEGAVMGGYPAVPIKQHHRQTITLQKLAMKEEEN